MLQLFIAAILFSLRRIGMSRFKKKEYFIVHVRLHVKKIVVGIQSDQSCKCWYMLEIETWFCN